MRISICLLSCAGLLAQSGVPDAKHLIEESIQAEAANQMAAASWLGREDIRHYTVAGRKKKLVGWQTYESSILEGRPYYRKIAIDGKPLSQRQAEGENQRMDAELQYRRITPPKDQVANDRRLGFGLKPTLLSHEWKMLRGEEVGGRKVWVVAGTLRPDASAPAARSDGGLSSDFLAWLDQQTKLTVREELTVRNAWMSLRPGGTVILEFDFSHGLRLVSRILLRGAPNEKGRFTETEQLYSGYKKFGSESHLILEQEP